MKYRLKTKYRLSKFSNPDIYLWSQGWNVRLLWKGFGYYFTKYQKSKP